MKSEEIRKTIANILATETNLTDAKERIRKEIPKLHYSPFYETVDTCGIKHFVVYAKADEQSTLSGPKTFSFIDPYDNWTYSKLKSTVNELCAKYGKEVHDEMRKLRQFDYDVHIGPETYVCVFGMPTHDRIAFAWSFEKNDFVGDAMSKYYDTILWNNIPGFKF